MNCTINPNNPTSELFINTQMGPSACHITNNLRLIYFKAARNDYEITTLHRTDSRKPVLDWALQQMGLELNRADLRVLPYSSLKALYFTLTWRGKSTAEHSNDTRTSWGCSTVHPWTSANLSSLRRPSYAGIIFNAHFKPVLGKWYKTHRGHTMKTLILINPFYKEENRKQANLWCSLPSYSSYMPLTENI